MDKTFDPEAIEARINAAWEQSGAFRAGAPGRKNAEPFTIVIPPPNVTGSLHMGHALNNTLQDILCRFWRMKGKDVLWQPGTDHAGIATQMVVERQMMERQEPGRLTIGREAFLDKVWAWKAESGGTIVNQLKRLGASCDWSRERFTMGRREEGEAGQMQQAVIAFFNALNAAKGPDGRSLLYKDKRLVNWDPKLLTAISDLEVEQREIKGSFSWAREELTFRRSPDEHRPEGIGQGQGQDGHPKPFDAEALAKVLDREPGGHLYFLDYPIEGEVFDPENPATFVTVATTRPETMLGDTGVAVHPENEKLRHLIGRRAILPLVGRPIPIFGDEYADPEKGTGAVKITPAHDFNDFEVGRRHGLAIVNIFTREGRLTDLIDQDFCAGLVDPAAWATRSAELAGLDRFAARKRIVALIESIGLLRRIEPHLQQVPHGDRSGVPIEPFLTEQWYVNVKPLAEQAMEWVRAGKVKILPAGREADFFRWMENIEPWCISRQLWWGHQIPAWYGPKFVDGQLLGPDDQNYQVFVAPSEQEALRQAEDYYRDREIPVTVVPFDRRWDFALSKPDPNGVRNPQCIPIHRDPDVLDTWFSSALWPFSTLGWPETTAELEKYYPTSVLVTAADILFFWVARMMMAAAALKHADGTPLEPPFHTVYLHGLVRDEKGRKMSKSVGNVIDPLSVIDTLGADALRFALASLAAQGRDPKLGVKTAEGYRNFCTKLWNAARFAELNGCLRAPGFDPQSVTQPLNIWAIAEADAALVAIEAGITGFKFNEAALAAYKFTWNTFCDWFLELAKPALQGEDGPAKAETRATTAFLLDRIVMMLHPFMPYITEELWATFAAWTDEKAGLLVIEAWPQPVGIAGGAAARDIAFLVELISEIRSARAEMNVPAATLAPLVFVALDAHEASRMRAAADALKRLARIAELKFEAAPPAQSMQIVVQGVVACLPLAGIIDFAAEKKRLAAERERLARDVEGTLKKLNNPDFVARAPEEVVDENRERVAEAEGRIARVEEALKRLG